jgi:hypothetical protein
MESEEAKKFLRGVQAEIAGQNARMLMQVSQQPTHTPPTQPCLCLAIPSFVNTP